MYAHTCTHTHTHTGTRRRSISEGSGSSPTVMAGSLCDHFEARKLTTPRPVSNQRKRVTSAPPIRTVTTIQPSSNYQGLTSSSPLQRRRSFTAFQESFPSRSEMIRDIFTVYPAPQPQPVSKFKNRPSSAVTLRAGKIPRLRQSNPWV